MASGQFVYEDLSDALQKLVDPPNDVCQSVSGKGTAANLTDTPVYFYDVADCKGGPILRLLPGESGSFYPFASIKFTTGLP
jgi:hypothetical protein